jgi:hypothetical protein
MHVELLSKFDGHLSDVTTEDIIDLRGFFDLRVFPTHRARIDEERTRILAVVLDRPFQEVLLAPRRWNVSADPSFMAAALSPDPCQFRR